MSGSNPLLDAALQRAREGACVVPLYSTDAPGACDCPKKGDCKSAGKHPRLQNGAKGASADPAVIERWWGMWPDANLGVVDDFVRLDVDASDIAALLLDDQELPFTHHLTRTRRGLHITFAASGCRTTKLKLACGRVIGDVKTAPGYVLVPPSRIGAHVYERLSPEWVEPAVVDDPVAWLGERLAPAGHVVADTGGQPAYRGIGAGVREGGRHDALLSYAGKIFVEGMDDAAFVAVLESANGAICAPPLPLDEVESIARHFVEHRERRGMPGRVDMDTPGSPKPEIIVTNRHLHATAEAAWAAVQAANNPPRFFVHGRDVAEVGRDPEGRASIDHLTMPALRGRVDRCADWVKETKDGLTPARPPKDVVEDMLALEKPLPWLKGIVGTPTFSCNGLLDCTPGYQPATKLYYEPLGEVIPAVPDAPDVTDLKRAKAYLHQEWLADFPFLDAASLAHAIAVPLTVVAREMIDGPTPLFAIDAPAPGSGKGLLASSIGIIVSGREAAVMTETRGDEERKRITALVRAGHPLLLLDNVKRKLESGTFAALLTAPYWPDRLLGASEEVDMPTRGVWMATGNNLQFDSDISRRTVWIRIDARVDRPWERGNFRKENLILWARRHRPELAWACLVLVRHWIAAGMTPWRGRPLGSYESWCAVVGGVLGAAGIDGFLENRDELYSRADAETEEWRAFVRRWHTEHGEGAVKAADVLEIAQESVPAVFEQARDGASQRSLITRLGKALAARRDRSFEGTFIRRAGEDAHDGGALWRVVCGTSRSAGPSTSADVPQDNESTPGSFADVADVADIDPGSTSFSHSQVIGMQEECATAISYPHVPQHPQTDSKRAENAANVVRKMADGSADVPQCRKCGGICDLPSSNLCGDCRRESLADVMRGQT